MAAERPDAVGSAEELDDVILAYVEAVEAGQPADRTAWLTRYPHLADELGHFFADQDQFSSLVAPICVNTPPPQRGSGAVALEVRPPLASGCLIGDYELLDDLACGGMGVVYKARHQKLGRVVALKMIRAAALAQAEDVARFRLEAEAVAALDHPNIVPIYDVGEHDGRPYFTMKLIDGGSLAAALGAARWSAAPRAAAQLVATVARAVHYAHERGILHRDLKPANILLDRQGEPHVSDFGLATRLPSATTPAPAHTLTQKGIAVGTPGYMAPEQANGPKAGVTVAADVYSLGAVLYELLTGRPPFQADTPLETLVQVLERPPARPRSLAPAVPRDLETICLKCLEKDPARRYASAEALADDLQRFLDGEPIQARPAGTPERVWRWCRRSPAVATLAAALAVAVTGGLVAVTFLWQRAEGRRLQAEEQRQLAEAALRSAREERERAEAHRLEAEEGFRQAHQVVERFCMRLSEERLSHVPGLQPVRRDMLAAGLKYYQDFVAKRSDDPDLKADLAKAHFRVAFLTNLVGSKRDALDSYAQALKTYEELSAADPDNCCYREQIAMTCINMGGVLEATNERKAALDTYERARDLLEGLDRASPGSPKVLANLGILYNNLGNVNRVLNHLDESQNAYEKALAVQERLSRNDPRDPVPLRELAVVYVNVAILYSTRGDKDEALRWHEKARDLQEKLFHDHPSDTKVQHDLALTCRRIGDRLVRDGRSEEGMRSLEKGHGLIEKLAAANGSVTEYQWELALSHRSLGHAEKAAKDKVKAAASYRAAIDLLRKVRRQDSSAVTYSRDLAATLFDLALLLSDESQKWDEAIRSYAQSADLYRELARSGSDADALADLAAACTNLGLLRRDARRTEGALAAFTEARDAREILVRLRPNEPRYRNDLAGSWFNIGRMQSFLKRHEEETRGYERSREIREQLVKEYPENVAYHHDLGTTLVNLGYTYAQTERIDEGLATLRRAVEEKRFAFTAAPQSPEHRRGMNNAYGALAEVERQRGTPSASAAALLERRELWPSQPQELYRIACEQTLTAAAVARNKEQLSAEEQAERTRYLDQAMGTLRQAVAAGFSDADRLAKEADLALLRPREDFQQLLSGLKK
jgi:serine/threonine-protein kinase